MGYYGQTSFKLDEYNWRNWPQIFVTLIIILANIIVAAIGFFGRDLWPNFSLIVKDVKENGEYYRMVTSIFIHADGRHILMNMIALFATGRILERVTGHFKFLVIYLFSGVCGSVMILFIEDEYVMSGGASGAIFGLLGALIVYMLVTGDHSMLFQAFLMLVLEVGTTFLDDGISIGGHMGGLIGGLILGALLIREKDSLNLY